MNSRIRLGIVGCGAIAEQMHIPAIRRSGHALLTAVVDQDAERAARTAASCSSDDHPVVHGTSIAQIAESVDALVLCTPPHVRPLLTEQACFAGLHVLCEKPFANSISECDRMIEAAEKTNRVLAAAHIFRFWPAREAIRQIVQTQEFGAVVSATATQGNPYGWATVTGYNMRPGLVPGGVLFDAGIHPLDSLIWWFGTPKVVQYSDDSLGSLESNVRLELHFESVRDSVRFRQSRTAPMSNEFRITFEHATIVLSNYSPSKFTVLHAGGQTVRDAASDQISSEPDDIQLQNFVDSIISQRVPKVTGRQAREVIQLIEECYAIRKQRPYPVTAPLPGITR